MDGRFLVRGAAVACALVAFTLGDPGGVTAQEGTYSTPHGQISAHLDCAKCHTSEGWTPQKSPLDFDHDTQTGFPLTGRHAEADCTRCHLRRQFDQPEADAAQCAICHVDVHQGALGSDCGTCHETDGFPPTESPGDAHGRSSFPLTGAHELISCESCHVDDRGGRFSPLDTDCFSCHEADYASAQFVDHPAQGFPTDCLECHSVIAWRHAPAFDHGAQANGFELVGAHTQTSCESCHRRPGNELLFTPTGQDDCFACHRSDYDGEHAGSGIPTTCAECHTVDGWDGATFDHGQTGFDLVGAHTTLNCDRCHIQPGNQLINTPSGQDDCVACHQADYNQEHAGTGFPTTCLTCHDTTQWPSAVFDHDAPFFPIYSGKHQAKWNDCQDCHPVSGNFQVFSCLGCHEHRQSAMDDKHKNEPGYVYQSSACLSCHPDGRNDD